ncbi:MAG: CDP-archaeol synthase [Bacteroidota bacterium]
MLDTFLFIMVPLIVTNVLHMVLVKSNGLSTLAVPIHHTWFGQNKTWRGILFVTITNALLSVLCHFLWPTTSLAQALGLGALLGLTYMVFELPNSYLKRRLGIAPGQKARQYPILFMMLDKTDSTTGVTLVTSLVLSLSLSQGLLFFALAVALHVSFSLLLTALRIKKRF